MNSAVFLMSHEHFSVSQIVLTSQPAPLLFLFGSSSRAQQELTACGAGGDQKLSKKKLKIGSPYVGVVFTTCFSALNFPEAMIMGNFSSYKICLSFNYLTVPVH